MKLLELTSEPLVLSLIRKLQAKGETVALHAQGGTILSGSDKSGWHESREFRSGKLLPLRPEDSRFVHYTNDANYSITDVKRPNFVGSMHLELPIDDHYILKKVSGVWTLLDKE